MQKILTPGRTRKSVTLLDNITYSEVTDKEGNKIKLHLSLMMQHGNIESRLANGIQAGDGKEGTAKPVIIWVPGGGYRGSDKNLMVPEMKYLADAGFAVASIYYRSSSQGTFPAQIIDVKTAVRYLRTHAGEYNLKGDKIGVMGRSAGGHLAALAGMNQKGYDSPEWSESSSDVQAACDLFGPVDVPWMLEKEEHELAANPNYRWKRIEDTHPGALMGGEIGTMKERAKAASPGYLINEKNCPMLIMHGDKDRHVPMAVSEQLYQALKAAGYENQTDYYMIKNANHGSDEFFQPEIQNIISEFFARWLA